MRTLVTVCCFLALGASAAFGMEQMSYDAATLAGGKSPAAGYKSKPNGLSVARAVPKSVPQAEARPRSSAVPARIAVSDPPLNSRLRTRKLQRIGNRPIEPSSLRRPFAAVGSNRLQDYRRPPVRARALFCMDCGANKVMLAQNISEPMPIASITKLLTAMVVVEEMNLNQVVEVPEDIAEVERVRVGIRPGDLLTVRDLLHGMLMESGNDCAEALARAYPKGGREGFIVSMGKKAAAIGAKNTRIFTPSGLDMKITLGRKDGRNLDTRRPNLASAEDVAIIARHAFRNPTISSISSMRTYTMQTKNPVPRDYPIHSNDRLLAKNLPIAGAKTGFTNMAGKCIVALFKDDKKEHMVVVLNTNRHFQAAERIYRWACKVF